MYYPEFTNYLSWLTGNRGHYAITHADDKVLLDELFSVMKMIKASNNGWRTIYISLERGPEPDDEECQEMVELGEYESKESYLESWREYNAMPFRFYRISAGENEEGFRVLSIDYRYAMEYDPRGYEGFHSSDISFAWGDELQTVLKGLVEDVRISMAKVLDGTYDDWLKENLPARNRLGRIRRSDIWEAFPGSRDSFLEGLADDEIHQYSEAVDRGLTKRENIGRLERMTSGEFFRACAIGYRAVGESEYGLRLRADSDKGLYLENADGRDDGLTELPEGDSDAFDEWSGGKKDFNGGHPWEVCRGGNSTHVDFFPIKDERGWCFGVRGKHRMLEVVRFYLAISRAGLPVYVADDEAIRDGILGKDIVGIVPEGVFPRYCESLFPNEMIVDFTNLDLEDEENAVFMAKAVFDDPDPIALEE